MFGVFVAPLCLVFIVITGMTWELMVINCFLRATGTSSCFRGP